VWSFFGSDVGKAGRELLAPLVEAAWPGYTVRFPQYDRQLDTSYYAMTSARLDARCAPHRRRRSCATGARWPAAKRRSRYPTARGWKLAR
jgi:lycopene beta-cyclase